MTKYISHLFSEKHAEVSDSFYDTILGVATILVSLAAFAIILLSGVALVG